MKLKLVLFAIVLTSLSATFVEAQSYAITNARIVTVSGPAIEKGTIVVRDGLIAAVGVDAKAPADAQVSPTRCSLMPTWPPTTRSCRSVR